MSLRRELRAAGGFVFGLVGLFLAYVHRGDLLVAPFAVLGAALLLGAALALRERPRAASRAWRWGRRALTVATALGLRSSSSSPRSPLRCGSPRRRASSVRPFDLAHEDVSLHTRDGLRLAAWYVPSRNGAAVVVVHGGGGTRNGSERHARMLARAGYGVLLYDARGNGESEGRHDAMGWTWEPDVAAAVDFLSRRPDVRGRIGALGISTGAEAVLQAAARNDEIAAVVSDGAIARNLAETRQLAGVEELQAVPYFGLLFGTIRTLTGTPQPQPLQQLVPEIAPRPVLLIASGAGTEQDDEPRLPPRGSRDRALGAPSGRPHARPEGRTGRLRAQGDSVLRRRAPTLGGVSALPTGTVTFFFADVEGSTRLARELGEGWQPVLADLRRLLREAVAAADGSEVDSRGDELFAAFAEAETAAQAAVDAQRKIAGHTWPTPVRVRIGLHTGVAALGEDGYVGVEVHRAFRIANAGHGGQIVASETTALVLAPGRELRDLGLWALPELPEPERIFQLDEPGLGGDFPALRARPGATPVRVVLADDSVLLREGVARLLDDAGFDVVAQSGNADDLLRHVAMHKPDVAVVDIRMPPTQTDEGLRAAKEIRESHPEVGVLVLSQYVEPGYAMDLLSDSAESVGYLLKDRVADVDEFAAAVRRVAEGGSALDPAVVSQLVGRHRRDDPLAELSPREREVLELMAEGRSNQAIAERLFVTLRAVEKHVTSIFVKLRLTATAEDHRRVLAVLALLRG